MESIFKMMEKTAYIVIFCLAVVLLYKQYNEFCKYINMNKKYILDDIALYRQYNYQNQTDTVTYDEVIAGLINSIEYDVKINNLYISKSTFDNEIFEYNQIPKYKKYNRSVVYDSSGNITLVVYKGVN